MVIFHSYVKLPEGKSEKIPWNIWRADTPSFHHNFTCKMNRCGSSTIQEDSSPMPWPHLQNMAVEIATGKEPLVDAERTSSWPPQSETHLLILSPFPLKSPFWKITSQTQALYSHIYIYSHCAGCIWVYSHQGALVGSIQGTSRR